MGKRNGIALLALLVAVGGLGLGVYSVFFSNTSTSEIMQIWTKEQPAIYYTTGSYVEVPDMDITITVNTGESVLIIFNGQFLATPGVLIGGVRFMRDNVEIPNSRRDFNIETTGGVLMAYSLTANILIDNLAAGTYEIELQAYAAGGTDRLDDGLLIIYTFI